MPFSNYNLSIQNIFYDKFYGIKLLFSNEMPSLSTFNPKIIDLKLFFFAWDGYWGMLIVGSRLHVFNYINCI
jgi:hypothetical protein